MGWCQSTSLPQCGHLVGPVKVSASEWRASPSASSTQGLVRQYMSADPMGLLVASRASVLDAEFAELGNCQVVVPGGPKHHVVGPGLVDVDR